MWMIPPITSGCVCRHLHLTRVYIYIYIYMYVCIYIYIYIYMYVCMYVCIHIYIYTHVCVYVYIYIYSEKRPSSSGAYYYRIWSRFLCFDWQLIHLQQFPPPRHQTPYVLDMFTSYILHLTSLLGVMLQWPWLTTSEIKPTQHTATMLLPVWWWRATGQT